ncbi:hypothetical protein [Aporhodopirellula aestuarii]|uniref:Uncharacterized protein n=1 Tax=Aporhodopirellula aestuarii TaxID=2950107 RepID=A0ABT0U455_9BACT|nr:hypothetical protein [Aporhodopirellula aestuarii]MCM2371682.1 hypothetical protein [Aporhodopirellula aestuarii]
MDTYPYRPYRRVLYVVAGVWLIVACGSILYERSVVPIADNEAPQVLSTADMVMIAVLSGMIAFGSIMPGWSIIIPPPEPSEPEPEAPEPNTNALATTKQPVKDTGTPLEPQKGPERERLDEKSNENDEIQDDDAPPQPLSPRALAIERLGHAFLIGMMIRIAGTVALFLSSSYYMDASPTRIGIWVLAWHLVLLMTEVITLSREIRIPTPS